MPHSTQAIFKVNPLGKTFACEISGPDFSEPLSDDAFQELTEIVNKYGVAIVRKTKADDDSLIALGRRFGDLDSVRQHYKNGLIKPRVPKYEIFDVGNLNEKDEIVNPQNDPQRLASGNGNATWHADGAFNPRRTGISILRGVELPPKGTGGHTEYIDSRTAYEDLPPETKEKIKDYVTCNSIFHNRKVANPDSPLFAHINVLDHITAKHKLIQTHEGSGRHNIYITSYAHHIDGMDIEEGQAILKEIFDHCKQEKYKFYHHWENNNDVAIWDNTCVLHRATHGSYEGKYRRDMRRVSVFDMTKWGYGENKVEDAENQAPSQ
ncbi:hypothetical protein LTR67_010608 [Exophiala xenobiotica]